MATYETCWEQIGTDILGDSIQNAMGASVALTSLSTETYVVAAGAYGYVRVYRYNTTSNDEDWESVGERIEGEQDYDEFGATVDLSSDGRILAVGAPFHDDGVGHVRMFRYNTTDWIPMGDPVVGEFPNERFGKTVSLSSGGRRVIVGNSHKTQGLTRTRVYAYVANTTDNATEGKWERMGSEILGLTVGDASGYSVAIDDDGDVVAVGAPDRDEGHVRTLRWNGTEYPNGRDSPRCQPQRQIRIVRRALVERNRPRRRSEIS